MIQEDLKGLRDSWFWFLILGVTLMVLGIAALSYSTVAGVLEVALGKTLEKINGKPAIELAKGLD